MKDPPHVTFGLDYGLVLTRDLVDERRDRTDLEVCWPLARDHYLTAETDPPRAAPPLGTHRTVQQAGQRRIGQHGGQPCARARPCPRG